MTATFESPYVQEPGREYIWLKGNLHAHSTRSDGSRPPQAVVDSYAALGYDFMALSDHDTFSDYAPIDAKGMVLIPANEVTVYGSHVLQVGGSRRIEADEDRQKVIDQINADGGMAVLNHPNWQAQWDHYSFAMMRELQGYIGIEIFNGVCLAHEGSGFAVDKWDRLLSDGRRVWGLAHDDSHGPGDVGRGWNVVRVRRDQRNAEGIMAALRAGNFYASTGVTIDVIESRGAELHLKAADAQEIEVYGEKGVRLASVLGSEIRFDASDCNSGFIRVQCYGRGSAMAWTQPLVVRGGTDERRRAVEAQFAAPDSPRPVLTAQRVKGIPPLGGSEIERLWTTAAAADVFYDMHSADHPPVRTALRALVSADQLALRIDCQEPEMDKVQPRITENGNSSIWADESLEIFLDAEGKRERYYHMMINPLGAFYVGHPLGWGKTLKCQTRARRDSGGWSVELCLDLNTLVPGVTIEPGRQFALHVCRNRKTVDRHYIWSWVGKSNHRPERFGRLQI